MTWEEFKTFIKGKVFLIGITFTDGKGNVVDTFQASGKVTELTDEGILRFIRPDNSIYQLPYERESISEAQPGEYKEKATGHIVVNPDYITTWTITINDNEHIDKIKEKGYLA